VGILGKTDIFAAQDIKRESFPVPEWGGDIELIQLSGSARARIMLTYQEFKDRGAIEQTNAMQDAMLIACIADDTGAPIFATEDLPELHEKNGVVLERIVKAAMVLNGMSAAEEDAEKKGSETVPSGASPSVSVSP